MSHWIKPEEYITEAQFHSRPDEKPAPLHVALAAVSNSEAKWQMRTQESVTFEDNIFHWVEIKQ